jgi:hypothetical protein
VRLVVAYGGWVLTAAAAFWLVTILHTLAVRAYVLLRLGGYGMAIFNDAVFFVLLLLWLGWVVASEHWLRQSAASGRVGATLARLLAPVAAVAVVGWAALRLA